MKDALGDKYKALEIECRSALQTRVPVVVRVDGKAFHTYTRKLNANDPNMAAAMWAAAEALCTEMMGARFAYTQCVVTARAYTVPEDRLLAAAALLGATVWWRRGLGQVDERGYFRVDLPGGGSVYGSDRERAALSVEARVGLLGAPKGVGGAK